MKLSILIAVVFAVGTAHADNGLLGEVKFEPGSSEIPIAKTAKAQLALGKASAWAIANPDGLLVLDGHADRDGRHADNVRLSLARAKTVKAQLELAGVPEEQIVIAAYGEARAKRSVVIWGTRAGMDAIVARTFSRGYAVIWNGILTDVDRRPAAGVEVSSARL